MSEPIEYITLDQFIANAPAILDRIEAVGGRVIVEYDARLFALRPQKRSARRPRRHFSVEDPLFRIAGIGQSDGPSDVSSNKHKYLADAAANLHPDSSPPQQP